MGKLVVTLPRDYPGRNIMLQKLADQAWNVDPEEDKYLTPWARAIKMYYNPSSPAFPGTNIPGEIGRTVKLSGKGMVPWGSTIEGGLPSLSPIAQGAVGLTTGKNAFNQDLTPEGTVIDRGQTWTTRINPETLTDPNKLLKSYETMHPTGQAEMLMRRMIPVGRGIARSIPQIPLLESMFTGKMPDPNDPLFGHRTKLTPTPSTRYQSPLQALQAFMTGISTFEVSDPLAKQKFLESRDRAFKQAIKDAGLELANPFQE